jgi:hypothetical protein
MMLAGAVHAWAIAGVTASPTAMFRSVAPENALCSSSSMLYVRTLLIQSWVHEYKEDRTHALAALLTFFVQVAAWYMAHHGACRRTQSALNA